MSARQQQYESISRRGELIRKTLIIRQEIARVTSNAAVLANSAVDCETNKHECQRVTRISLLFHRNKNLQTNAQA